MVLELLVLGSLATGQAPSDKPGVANASFKSPVTQTDLHIARRAAELLDSPQKWNRGNVGDCTTDTTGTLTLYCSLDKAAREVSGALDERSAVRQESRAVIAFLAVNQYGIDDYNSDPKVTFSDVQAFFHVLQDRLAMRMAAENPSARRQDVGDDSESRPPVTEADVRIVRRAKQILLSSASWNRADTRVCPEGAKTFSIYCALERATKEVTGSFEHRGAAMQESRLVVEDIAPNAGYYGHRLMDFNNDPATTFFDVQKFFQVLESRITDRLAQQTRSTRRAK